MPLRFLLPVLALAFATVATARDHIVLLGTYTTAESRGIYAVRLNSETGAISEPELVAQLASPEFLVLHPNGKMVYALTQSRSPEGRNRGAVAAFTLDAATGRLTPLNVQSSNRGTFAHLAIDATGKMVMAASYGDPYIVSFPIEADGRVGPFATLLEQSGPTGPNRPRQDASHPHSITVSPDNRYAFVANLGLDRVLAYQMTPEKGTLAPHDPAFVALAAGAGPRHTKFSPDGKFFYVLHELDGSITACRYVSASGVIEPFQRVSTLPENFTGRNGSSEIRVHPTGNFVYAANRGPNTIAVFARDAATGGLKPIEIVATGGETPRNFSLSPDGRWLLCANQDSNTVTVFSVDGATGRLTATPHSAKISRAVCVLFLP